MWGGGVSREYLGTSEMACFTVLNQNGNSTYIRYLYLNHAAFGLGLVPRKLLNWSPHKVDLVVKARMNVERAVAEMAARALQATSLASHPLILAAVLGL